MSDQERAGTDELNFDRLETASTSSEAAKVAAVCVGCKASIETEYYQINGSVFCDRCRAAVEAVAETPRGMIPFITAAAFGLAAGVAGAAIYYAVIAIAHLEIGIVAILIGYMVGYAVRKGARGRGGRRFQVLAVALTYAAIALAYAPLAFPGAAAAKSGDQKPPASAASDGNTAETPAESGPVTRTRPAGGSLLVAVAFLLAFIAALPLLVMWGSFPSGLISALIMFFGMRQAWRMTGAVRLEIFGPYRVGAGPASTPA